MRFNSAIVNFRRSVRIDNVEMVAGPAAVAADAADGNGRRRLIGNVAGALLRVAAVLCTARPDNSNRWTPHLRVHGVERPVETDSLPLELPADSARQFVTGKSASPGSIVSDCTWCSW